MRPVLGEIEIKNERREAGSGGVLRVVNFFGKRCFGADGEGDGNLTGI
jgi:hypothetical protein